MAAANNPVTSGVRQNGLRINKPNDGNRHPTIEELLIQIENHLYRSIEHRASVLITVWTCLSGKIGSFQNLDKIFQMLYRESAMTILSGLWPKVDICYKRNLARALTKFSHSVGNEIKGSDGLCSALVMAVYDPWGDPVMYHLISREPLNLNLVNDFIKSEPFELLLIRIECLVNAHLEDAAIRLCRCCLSSDVMRRGFEARNDCMNDNWRWCFLEWLLRLLFRKERLTELVAEASGCSCHDGVRLIYRSRASQMEDSGALTETLINLFLVRDLLFQSNYCCTSELMKLWCDCQVQKQKSALEVQHAARCLLIGHASTSAQFYLFVDILWQSFGSSLLPFYLELYIRGLTSDLNFLEAARQAENKETVIEIENHMAAMYFKLSSMFISVSKEIALECMLSAFSLNPTREQLEWIKKLSLQIARDKATLNRGKPHKSCIKNGPYHNCTIPGAIKRKAVVMCDQSTQVGDDSFALVEMPSSDESKLNQSRSSDATISMNLSQISHENVTDDEVPKLTCHEQNELNKGSIIPSSESLLTNHTEPPETIRTSLAKPNADEVSEQNINENDVSTSDVNKERTCNPMELEDDEMQSSLQANENKIVENHNDINDEAQGTKINNVENFHDIDGSQLCIDQNGYQQETCNEKEDKNEDIKMRPNASQDSNSLDLAEPCKATENAISNEINSNDSGIIAVTYNHVSETTKSDFLPNNDTDVNMSEDLDEHKASPKPEEETINAITESIKSPIGTNSEQKETVSSSVDKIEHNLPSLSNSDSKEIVDSVLNENTDSDAKQLCNSNSILQEDIKMDSDLQEDIKIDSDLKKDIKIDSDLQKDIKMDSDLQEDIKIDSNLKEACENSDQHECEKISDLKESCSKILELKENGVENLGLKQNCNISELKENCGLDSNLKENCNLNLEAKNCDKEQTSINQNDGVQILENVKESDAEQQKSYNHTNSTKNCIKNTKNLNSFTHVILDSKIPGISPQLLSDFAPVLESLRNRQLQSSSKWSQIKHLCEDYLVTVSNLRSMIPNNVNGSVDSEADSASEFTPFGSFQSIAGNLKDERRLVLERFMNHEKGMPSYVNLSDIRHPKISLDKLFHDDQSSHGGHKKRHRKHRKQDKDGLRKLHHRSRADIVKHKKRKKRKGKREKGHAKKHHSPHGKISKECLKTKKKKHKVKKKKDGNSSFISGDYCSDFSSAELIRIVNEHSNYPMQTPKHPQASALNVFGSPSMASSDGTEEPSRKKRKQVTFSKKKETKCHKHEKSNKRKKKIVIENCETKVENVTSQNKTIEQNSLNDYSHIVQMTSVKKMEAVQIRQRSVSLVSDVSKVKQDNRSKNKLVNQSAAKSQLLVPPDFENYSREDIMKMQLLMANQQQGRTNISSSEFDQNISSNQSVLKYVCSKMTSRLLSVAQSSSCVSNAEATKPPVCIVPNKPQLAQNVNAGDLPLEAPQNVKYIIFEKNSLPYATPASNTLVPVTTFTTPGTSTLVSPTATQITRLTIPLPHDASEPPRNKVITVIPFAPNQTSTVPIPLSDGSSNQSLIIMNNNGNTQIIANNQQQGFVPPVTNVSRISVPRMKQCTALVHKTVPKMIKQAAKKLTQSHVKKPVSNVLKVCTDKPSKIMVSPAVTSFATMSSQELEPKLVNITGSSVPVPAASADSEPVKPLSSSPVSCTTEKSMPESSELKQMEEKLDASEPKTSIAASPSFVNEIKAPETKLQDEVEPKESDVQESTTSKLIDKNDESKETDSTENEGQQDERKSILPDNQEQEIDVPVISIKETSTKESVDVSPPETELVTTVDEEKLSEPSTPETTISSTDISSTVTVTKFSQCSSSEQLQPIIVGGIPSALRITGKLNSQGKLECGINITEVPTRSFTSISDAVRFSLMDMDDATGSVENQVLQAFQASNESSQDSTSYENVSTSVAETNSTPLSPAAMLTTQASETELSVSSVSQQFVTTVHDSEAGKFTECQSAVSRSTSWILESSAVSEPQGVRMLKSPDLDTSGELKDDDMPKKKRKKKERADPDATQKFWCQICHRGFFSAYNLRRHCRNVHKMDLPKGSSDVPFNSPSSQCHSAIQADPEVPARPVSFGVTQTCVSPKTTDYILQSPSREAKTQEFVTKSPSSQHIPQLQQNSGEFQTPPRVQSQSTSTHVSPITPQKEFRLQTPNTSTPIQSKLTSPNAKATNTTPPKFQRLPVSSATTHTQISPIAKLPQMQQPQQQIGICGQTVASQQPRPVAQMQSSALIQPLSGVACQPQPAQQASQCPHFQGSKQISQQRMGQLQLMPHVTQLPQTQLATHAIQKSPQVQQFKKGNVQQHIAKITETEQIQQAAQLAQNQIIANQQMQKLIQIRQNAIAASTQIPLGNAIAAGIQTSQVKNAAQCFQTQLAAARQAAVVAQIPAAQRAQGMTYGLPAHEASVHHFFSPAVQPSQDQASCSHSSYPTQSTGEFTATQTYPSIRLSTEANDGLEDLEQFLLENMPWSGDQAAHNLQQQSGNRPSSTDSLTLAIPSQASVALQNRAAAAAAAAKSKTSISKPKPRKPTIAPCSKNLLGNQGRGVKKKTCPKKVTKPPDTDCAMSKFQQSAGHLTAGLDQTQTIPVNTCEDKQTGCDFSGSNRSSICAVNENDSYSSDSVQCIKITHNPTSSAPVNLNFNTFTDAGLCSSGKNLNLPCNVNPSSNQGKTFLEQCSLGNKSNTNTSKGTPAAKPCDVNLGSCGSAFNQIEKEPTQSSDKVVPFPVNNIPAFYYTKKTQHGNAQDIFLGQRNSETSDSGGGQQKNGQSQNAITYPGFSNSLPNASASCQAIPGSASNQAPKNFAEIKSQHSQVPFLGGTGNKKGGEDDIKNCVNAPENSSNTVLCEPKNNEVRTENEAISTTSTNSYNLNALTDSLDKSPDAIDEVKPATEKKTETYNGRVQEHLKLKLSLKNNSLEIKHPDNTLTTKNQENGVSSCNGKATSNCDEKALISDKINHTNSSQSTVLNDENCCPKKNGSEGEAAKHNSPRVCNDISKFNQSDKIAIEQPLVIINDIQMNKNNKKRSKQENHEINGSDVKDHRDLDSKSTMKESSFEKDEIKANGDAGVCKNNICLVDVAKTNNYEDEGCYLKEKQTENACIDEVPIGRGRLRDTPKTSVKRTCPCCVDSHQPKKCRSNTSGTSKLPNGIKNNKTVKTKPISNGQTAKINTRSSQRLRSRNNAVN